MFSHRQAIDDGPVYPKLAGEVFQILNSAGYMPIYPVRPPVGGLVQN